MPFAIAKCIGLMCGLSLFAPRLWAAVQATPYIAIYSQPKYAALAAMPYANTNAPKGGYLSEYASGTFDNLNSMNGKGRYVEGVNYLFDSLMSSSLDEPNVMYPLLAEKVTFDLDHPNYIIFHLNPKARFSNGTQVTAQDVKFTFDTYQTKANTGLQMYLSGLAKTEVLSKYDVKMTFKTADNTELPLILGQMSIYSKADWKNKDFTRVSMQPILGSGPYLIDRIDAGRSITYKRNPNYWAKDLPVNKGRYNFDRLKYVYYRNMQVAFEGFKTGQYTLQEENSARTWMTEYNFDAAKKGLITKYILKIQTPKDLQSFVMNNRRTPFNDIYFRQALTYVYDFEWQNKAYFYGQYQRLQSYFDGSELAARGKPSAKELAILKPFLNQLHPLQRKGVLVDWKYPSSEGGGFNRTNLLKAHQILLDAGYRYQNGHLIDKKGKPIQIEFLIHQDSLQRTLMPYVRNLKKLGINVSIRVVDVPQYLERTRKNEFDMTTLRLPMTISPGNEQAQFWGSKAADEFGNYNFAGIKNPAIDHAIKNIIQAKNREDVVIYSRVLDRLLRAGYYHLPTYQKEGTWYAYWNMYKQPQVKPKLSAGIEYWWSDPVQAQKVVNYLRKQ
ncbi:ABC transporter substrate-binding protein [Acinetobacter sp. ANC 4470]|uniref:extracellular solute-binding protein n=1 Tax=Acinetobacter sp. ANC 4470 TaxID=1977881 RepID=UPI000A341228|nr:extracellular solute-binding protein [Acinetobacter sp. ANC 4470]OTG69191.1 ABC transporter substrate-binding protein [Acinetobacter sp. ANC 4470]